jgi:hypothetical protein
MPPGDCLTLPIVAQTATLGACRPGASPTAVDELQNCHR